VKRLKIFKAYFVLWLFVYFIAISNLETFKLYFLSTLTFNIAIVALLAIGTFMIFKAAKDLTMVTGTFGVLMYKKGDLSFYLKGIEKIFPSNIADKIKTRAKSGNLLFTQQESEDILAWLEEKYSNQNKYNNFFIGTVLMIGLLGTFAGLLGSIASMGSIVSSLAGSDVDIGKIMGDFAIPLSSMAVGFGSSLFGVISAILLSIKGYLLNKAQESLLAGVENWLQSKTVEKISDDNKAGALMPATTLGNHQKSYMDIFIEQIAQLSHEMKEVSTVNRSFQREFIQTVQSLQSHAQEEQALLSSMQQSLGEIAKNGAMQHEIALKTEHKLSSLESLQSSQYRVLEDLREHAKQQEVALEKREHTITNMVLKQERKEEENKMSIFQMADSLESMDNHIKHRLGKLEKLLSEEKHHDKSPSKLEDTMDFMKKHFTHEAKS
jgi:hypothetical protein